jgi:hypothetical protein
MSVMAVAAQRAGPSYALLDNPPQPYVLGRSSGQISIGEKNQTGSDFNPR